MKKILSIIAVAFAAMSFVSCENDDIEITKAVTINVNPATILTPYQNKYDLDRDPISADLADINHPDAQLVIRVLAYDENGNLVSEDKQLFEGKESNYTSVRKFEMSLGNGNYTIMALSYIQNKSNGHKMWELENYEKLSTATIKDGGYTWAQLKMLGLKVEKFNITSETPSLTVNLEPACTVIESYFEKVIYTGLIADVESYGLGADRETEKLQFDGSGNYTIQEKATGIWIYKTDYSIDYASDWSLTCILPVSSVNVGFYYEGKDYRDGSLVGGTLAEERISPKAGDFYTYMISFEFSEEDGKIYYDGGFLKNNRAVVPTRSAIKKVPTSQIMPTKASVINHPSEIRVIDFIKK